MTLKESAFLLGEPTITLGEPASVLKESAIPLRGAAMTLREPTSALREPRAALAESALVPRWLVPRAAVPPIALPMVLATLRCPAVNPGTRFLRNFHPPENLGSVEVNNTVRQSMLRESSYIEAEVVLLSEEEGGRSTPVLPVAYGGGLRPHIVLQDRSVRKAKVGMRDGHPNTILDDYLGVEFWSGPSSIPISSPFLLTMRLAYYPDLMYSGCIPGVTFTNREGGKIIGHGEVKRRWVEEETKLNPERCVSPQRSGALNTTPAAPARGGLRAEATPPPAQD